MATVNGYTAEHTDVVFDATVIDGEVIGDDLVLLTRGGAAINAGNVRGPAGAPGAGGGGFEQEQTFATASDTWIMAHMQGTKGVNVYTENSLGAEIRGDISYPDDDHVQVTFYYPQTGLMRAFN